MKIIAITDETNICECCGKSNLKRVVVIEKDNGDIVRYGTTCASKSFRSSKSAIDSTSEVYTYATKWLAKYSPEIVAEGIINKLGFYAEVNNGHIYAKISANGLTLIA